MLEPGMRLPDASRLSHLGFNGNTPDPAHTHGTWKLSIKHRLGFQTRETTETNLYITDDRSAMDLHANSMGELY